MPEVLGGKLTSMETCLLEESKSWIELTAAVEELTVLESWLEDTNAVLSETQDKVNGLPLTVTEEEDSSRLSEDQDNTSTSVVSEFGDMVEELQQRDQLQDQRDQEELEEDWDSTEELPNNQPTGEMEELKLLIHSRLTDSTLDGDKVLSPVLIPWMMPEVLGGKLTSTETCSVEESKSWTELTAVVVESTMLKSSLVADSVVSLEIQDKVPG